MRRELNGAGRAVAALVVVAAVALSGYAGLKVGMLVGLFRGADVMNNTPPRPTGLAPDLSGLANGAFAFGASGLAGLAAGLSLGAAAAWASCRLLLAPVLRWARWSSRPARGGPPGGG